MLFLLLYSQLFARLWEELLPPSQWQHQSAVGIGPPAEASLFSQTLCRLRGGRLLSFER